MSIHALESILEEHRKWLENPASGKRADLSDQDLSGMDISGANLSRADLSRANLSNANLDRANLSGSILTGATFDGATLEGANLSGAIYEVTALAKASFGEQRTADTGPASTKSPSAPEWNDIDWSGWDSTGEKLRVEKAGISIEEASLDSLDDILFDLEGETEEAASGLDGLFEDEELEEETGSLPPPEPAPVPPPAPAPAPQILPSAAGAPPAPPQPTAPPLNSPTRRKRGGSPFSAIGEAISSIFGRSENREVSVSAFAPEQIRKTIPFTVQTWLHWETARQVVEKRAKDTGHTVAAGTRTGLEIEEGVVVEFSLKPRILMDTEMSQRPQTRRIVWQGHPANVEFVVVWPENTPDITYETVEISVDGLPLGEATLCLRSGGSGQRSVVSEFRRVKRAFVSYSTKDTQRVLASIQAFQRVADVELFIDVDSLRAGEDWQERLRSEVPTRDAFLLYWSENAAQSEWVEREWRLAFEERGLDYIKPMPLDPVSPPEELADLQFADKWSRLSEYQRLKAGS